MTAIPRNVGPAEDIAVGLFSACALSSRGTVYCWGAPIGGSSTQSSIEPLELTGLDEVKDIALGGDSACVLLGSGQVKCWGDNSAGQLGNGTTSDKPSPTAVDVVGLP